MADEHESRVSWGSVIAGAAAGYFVRAAQDSCGGSFFGGNDCNRGCNNNTCGGNGALAFEVNQVEKVSALQAEVAALRIGQATDVKLANFADRVSERFAVVDVKIADTNKAWIEAVGKLATEVSKNTCAIEAVAKESDMRFKFARELDAKNQEIADYKYMKAHQYLPCSDIVTATACPTSPSGK